MLSFPNKNADDKSNDIYFLHIHLIYSLSASGLCCLLSLSPFSTDFECVESWMEISCLWGMGLRSDGVKHSGLCWPPKASPPTAQPGCKASGSPECPITSPFCPLSSVPAEISRVLLSSFRESLPELCDNSECVWVSVLLCLQALVSEILGPSKVALVVNNPPDNAGDVRAAGLIPGLGRSPGGRHGNPLQYSCLENPMDRGAGWATVYRVAKSRDRTEVTLHSPCLQTVVIKSPDSFRWPPPSTSASLRFLAVENRGAGRMLSKHSCLALLRAETPEHLWQMSAGLCPPPTFPRGLLRNGGHRHPREALPGLFVCVWAADTLLPSVWWSFLGECWGFRAGLLCSGDPCPSNMTQPTGWC